MLASLLRNRQVTDVLAILLSSLHRLHRTDIIRHRQVLDELLQSMRKANWLVTRARRESWAQRRRGENAS